MSKLDQAKKVIEENIRLAECGIFDTRNIVGDQMRNIYDCDGLVIDICDYYEYFEVFGLSQSEFNDLESFYSELVGRVEK